jgi:hypothetical protein
MEVRKLLSQEVVCWGTILLQIHEVQVHERNMHVRVYYWLATCRDCLRCLATPLQVISYVEENILIGSYTQSNWCSTKPRDFPYVYTTLCVARKTLERNQPKTRKMDGLDRTAQFALLFWRLWKHRHAPRLTLPRNGSCKCKRTRHTCFAFRFLELNSLVSREDESSSLISWFDDVTSSINL